MMFWRKFETRLLWGIIDFHTVVGKKNTMEVNGASEQFLVKTGLPVIMRQVEFSIRVYGIGFGWLCTLKGKCIIETGSLCLSIKGAEFWPLSCGFALLSVFTCMSSLPLVPGGGRDQFYWGHQRASALLHISWETLVMMLFFYS